MMRIHFLLIASTLIFGACSSDDQVTTVDKSIQMTVMSSNIRYAGGDIGTEHAWENRRDAYKAMINDVRADVVGLQEVWDQQKVWIEQTLTDYAVEFKNVHEGVPNSVGAYNAVIYRKDRFTLLDKGGFWLSATPDEVSLPWQATDRDQRVAIWLRLRDKSSQKEFVVLNTHLPWRDEQIDGVYVDRVARDSCVNLIIARLKQIAGRHTPIFVTGDMNTSYHSTAGGRNSLTPFYQWMWAGREEAPDNDPKEVYSFNGFGAGVQGPTRNIDHIFYRLATPLKFRTINSPDYGVTYISDHYPITLSVKF